MSAIALDWYTNCSNKGDSIESIIKRLILTDSAGHLYLSTDSLFLNASSDFPFSFTNAALTSRTIDGTVHTGYVVTHNFGTTMYGYVVKDNNGNQMMVGEDVIDNDSTFIIIDQVITGTWNGTMFKF